MWTPFRLLTVFNTLLWPKPETRSIPLKTTRPPVLLLAVFSCLFRSVRCVCRFTGDSCWVIPPVLIRLRIITHLDRNQVQQCFRLVIQGVWGSLKNADRFVGLHRLAFVAVLHKGHARNDQPVLTTALMPVQG